MDSVKLIGYMTLRFKTRLIKDWRAYFILIFISHHEIYLVFVRVFTLLRYRLLVNATECYTAFV